MDPEPSDAPSPLPSDSASTEISNALLPFNGQLAQALASDWVELDGATLEALCDELVASVGPSWMARAHSGDPSIEGEVRTALLERLERADEDPDGWRDATGFHSTGRTPEQWAAYCDATAGRGFDGTKNEHDAYGRGLFERQADSAPAVVITPPRQARARGAGRPRAAGRSSSRGGDSGDSSGSSEGDGEPPPPEDSSVLAWIRHRWGGR